MSTEPVPHLPDLDDLTERDLVTFIGGADAIEARNHAARLLWIARWARHRGWIGELATADGRGRGAAAGSPPGRRHDRGRVPRAAALPAVPAGRGRPRPPPAGGGEEGRRPGLAGRRGHR